MERKYLVFGLGNALMDMLVEVDYSAIGNLGLQKGKMQLVDEEQSRIIQDKVKGRISRITAGGSASNTIAAVAGFGGSAVFCGTVGSDELGIKYIEETKKSGAEANISAISKMTGSSIALITPDTDRTFATHLGAAIGLRSEHIDVAALKSSMILHTEGYMLEEPELRKTAVFAMDIAKASGVMVSIDLSDPALIKRIMRELRGIVKTYADIVFANEEEALAFTGCTEAEDALLAISNYCHIAIVKRGVLGSLVRYKGVTTNIPATKANAVDTTGAGDMYAAGVLYMLASRRSITDAARLGSLAASRIVEVLGARSTFDLKALLRD